jgi:phytoene dehydrogenase-like protein
VCVLERRELVGGACITEEVWPGQRVSRASYVVSMLQPKIVKDLDLPRFGYEAVPLDPPFATFRADGRPILFDEEGPFEEFLARMADMVRPLMLRPPTVPSLLRAARPRKRDMEDLFRMMTMSVGDLLDEWFDDDAVKGAYASTGVVGVWAGPRTPGTAYNLLHHALGELNGVPGAWGHVKGGMGALSNALARSAESAGATVRTDAPVRSIDIRGDKVTGVTLESGEEVAAPLVVSGAHPRTTILDLAGAEHFPEDVVRDMRRFKSRGGSVKVNCILSEPPHYERATPEERERLLRTGVALCPSIDHLERAWQDAVRGEPAAGPYVEVEVPTSIDPTLTDDGTTVMTLFTQYGPYREEDWPEGAREAYGERCLDIVAEHAPNVKDALIHHEVLAPPDIERIYGLVDGSIFQGEQGLDQMGFMRPSPALAKYATPVGGLYLCGAGTHPGGGVMGACGHNAAMRVLRDRKRDALRSKLLPLRPGGAPSRSWHGAPPSSPS